MASALNKQQGKTQIADLRASLRTTGATPARPKSAVESRPPKPRRAPKGENPDERAEKAERQAMLQHTTSLLDGGKKSKKPYVRIGERPEKKGGMLFQLLLVMIIAGGVAYALDPTLVPAEWTERLHALIADWMPA